jgi:hypothetical protein
MQEFLTYLGVFFGALIIYILKYFTKFFKTKVESKKNNKHECTRAEEQLPTKSQYIRQVEISSRMSITIEQYLRPNVDTDLYEIIISHIEDAKRLHLESVKVEFVSDTFINSSAISIFIRVAKYVKERNGIRLVFLFPFNSESAVQLYNDLNKLLMTWDSGRIELYLKRSKNEHNETNT